MHPQCRPVYLAFALAGGASASFAQGLAPEALRDQLNAEMSAGHQRIGYAATVPALIRLYADPGNPENILLFYTGRSQDKDLGVNEDGRNGWNREHLWPQSHGAGSEPMRSDLHHLKPTDASVNARRGSLDFDDGGAPEGEAPDTFLDGDSFEPRDEVKGDVARALFYMDVRYDGAGGEPDLVLVDRSTGRGSTLGDLCTLLSWHEGDPVDDGERARNDLIAEIQGNRNAFVDRPELAAALYGADCDMPAQPADAPGQVAVSEPPAAPLARLRLATWNIANFWHVPGEHLRPAANGGPGLIRSAADYDAIRAVLADLDADVIALQEIASPDSARALFPAEDWDLVFSRRFDDEIAANPDLLVSDQTRDIYEALVVRRDAATVMATERIELDLLHEDGRPVREGTAALLNAGGFPFWVASVHLKSGCFTDNDLTQRPDCRTLARQIPVLEDWLDGKSAAGQAVAVMGDFNRRLDRGGDVVREDLDDNDPVDLFKVPHMQELVCTAFSATPSVSIDYILANEALWERVTVPDIPKLDVHSGQVSDHCPVFVDLVTAE